MAKKLLFDLDVDSSASFETNAKEFYTKALVGDEASKRSTKHFRELLVVGEHVKIGNLMADDVIQEHDCDFNSTDMELKQVKIEPVILSIGVEVCQWDIEASFISEYTKNVGAIDFTNTSGLTPELEAHMLNEIARRLSNNIENLTWNGDTAGTTGTYLDFADGLYKLLAADADVINVSGPAITSSTVATAVETVYAAIPAALGNEVKLGMSTKALRMYRLAMAKANNVNYMTASLADKMLDYDVIEMPGMKPNDIIAADFSKNFIYATDINRDAELNVINMKQTTGDRKFRIIGDFKFGVSILNGDEIVWYQGANS